MIQIKPEWLFNPEQLTNPKYGSIANFNLRGALEVAALKFGNNAPTEGDYHELSLPAVGMGTAPAE